MRWSWAAVVLLAGLVGGCGPPSTYYDVRPGGDADVQEAAPDVVAAADAAAVPDAGAADAGVDAAADAGADAAADAGADAAADAGAAAAADAGAAAAADAADAGPGAGCPQDRGAMVRVPAGPFLFGEARFEVVVPHDYCIDVTEVTVSAFAACVAAGGCEGFADWDLCTAQDEDLSPNQCLAGRAEFPVNYVDWYRAEAYCAWAGKRLPFGPEWEKAARGEDGRTFPWGEGLDCTRAHVARGTIFSDCRDEGGLPNRPVAVGSYPAGASPYGLLDASGNVKEWIEFRADPTVLPPDGTRAVSRGGSYDEGDWFVTAYWGDATLGTDLTTQGHGFRCAADVDTPTE